MIPELGQVALIIALVIAVLQSVIPLYGAWRGDSLAMRFARPAAAGSSPRVTRLDTGDSARNCTRNTADAAPR